MSTDLLDRRKAAVGWAIIGLTAMIIVFSYVRDSMTGSVVSGSLIAIAAGFGLVSGSKKKEEVQKPFRWYHLVFAALSIGAGVVFGYYYLRA